MPTVTRIQWRPSYRLVPSRYPPVGLFDHLADPEDLDTLFELESLTNDRIRQEIGALNLVPREQRLVGPGTSPIMAAFTHRNPDGSRFSDGTFGVYYAGAEVETAIAETAFHQGRFLGYSREKPMEVDMRCYLADIDAELVDLRGDPDMAPLLNPASYADSRAFARVERERGTNGFVWESVRRPGGLCAGLFKPRSITPPCRQGAHYAFVWDGTKISSYYEKRNLNALT